MPEKHTAYDGRHVLIPPSTATMLSPAGGKIGEVYYAGWDDVYYVYVDGIYYVKATAAELAPWLVREKGANGTDRKGASVRS